MPGFPGKLLRALGSWGGVRLPQLRPRCEPVMGWVDEAVDKSVLGVEHQRP